MEEDSRSFLGRFGDFLIDGLQATAALELQSRFAPQDDRVFTRSPIGPTPVGAPTPSRGVTGAVTGDIVLLAVAAFVAFKLFG